MNASTAGGGGAAPPPPKSSAQGAGRAPSRIIVVGGGAGGLELAIRLTRLTRPGGRAQVALIDRSPTHIWKPRLHEVATGLLIPADEAARYSVQARRHGFTFELGEVSGLDPAARRLQIAAVGAAHDDPVATRARPEVLPARSLAYDVAVLAVGSTVNDFDTPGVNDHAYTLDDPTVAERFHSALLAQAARVHSGLQSTVRVVIVGAGSTGVELAGELRASAKTLARLRSLMAPDALEVTLLELGDHVLPSAAPALSRYAHGVLARYGVHMRFGTKVVRVEADRVHLHGGGEIAADLVVWASGVKAERLAAAIPGLAHGEGGRIRVDPTMRVLRERGDPINGLYALGDCAACTPPGAQKAAPATAQVAHQQAAVLARSLARQTRGRGALLFRDHDRGTLISLGEDHAAGHLPSRDGGLDFRGWSARAVYSGLYAQHLMEVFGVAKTAALRASSWLRRSTEPEVKVEW